MLQKAVKYPGIRDAVDGNTAVIHVEREASDAAGAYPITPSTQMGELWAQEAAAGHLNVSGRPLVFVEPESEHAAAAVTAGMAMTGLRATNFSSGQGIAFMHESLYATVGKRLPYVLNMGCRAITKASLNVHAGHDDYHCVDDTGFIQVMARSATEAADLNLIARRLAELSLTPAIVGQDGFLTTHLIESAVLPERALVAEYLGRPEDLIETPTTAQAALFGPRRRRVPAPWDVDLPLATGTVQNQDAYMPAVAAQRACFFDEVAPLADACMAEYAALTGRRYARVGGWKTDDADWLIAGMGSMVLQAEAVADWLRATRGLKVGVLNLAMFRPFPGAQVAALLRGKRGVAVLERTDQPLAEDLPLMRECRAALSKALENGLAAGDGTPPHPGYPALQPAELPRLYSGCYGLGSRDLQPEALVGAIENMLPGGARRPFFYLSVTGDRALHGSENPDLMPPGAISVRMHSVGGWGAITTGKNLALTLFELLGWELKANPKYGSEKKGQPTTYYLSVAPAPIRVNCELQHVDVVLSPDPAVFSHGSPLDGLAAGGVLVIQSALDSAGTWAAIPHAARRQIVERGIRVFHLDAFRIAREEAGSPELQRRMQGNAFQGAFFAASPVRARAGLSEDALFAAIERQLQAKFGAKGGAVVADNLRVVRRGYAELREITDKPVGAPAPRAAAAALPIVLQRTPAAGTALPPLADVHRFWHDTAGPHAAGGGGERPLDAFIAASVVPAASGALRDMTGIRFEHPAWIAERCSGCGKCVTACPDSAMPGLVNTVGEVLATALRRVQAAGTPTRHLHAALPAVEAQLRARLGGGSGLAVRALIGPAIDAAVADAPAPARERLAAEGELLKAALGDFEFVACKPYWSLKEKKAPGSGGLLSITVNPLSCKACGLCVTVCGDGALAMVPQTDDSVARLRRDWQFWLDLPTTSRSFIRVDDLDADDKRGALETLLFDKPVYQAMGCGDGACLGCGEKTAIHLFTAAVAALMQPRVKAFVARLDTLIAGLQAQGGAAAALAAPLQDLRWRYTEGPTQHGRAPMGMVNSTGCTSVWGSTWPYHPYPFPWTSHLFQDSPSVAMGLFEGHMVKMAAAFRAVRQAEQVLAGTWDEARDADALRRLDWTGFTDAEWKLCPPVVALGGDGAMYDIGLQNLSRLLMSGKPVKVLVVDTQVYSNTGGQACTSGFAAQVSDMAPYGRARHGKSEPRKEIALIGMAHRSAFVLQGSIAHATKLLDGFIDGLNSRRPALFNVYSTCPPEHGVGDDRSVEQSRLAVEGRAYPLFRYDPDAGTTFAECVSLAGNPAPSADWPSYRLKYVDEAGQPQRLDLPVTFADFAATEARFAKHFHAVPAAGWTDTMTPLAELLALPPAERTGRVPYLWALDDAQHLVRLVVADEMVHATEERLAFWRQLRGLAERPKARADQ